jgi:hypothetical protein
MTSVEVEQADVPSVVRDSATTKQMAIVTDGSSSKHRPCCGSLDASSSAFRAPCHLLRGTGEKRLA